MVNDKVDVFCKLVSYHKIRGTMIFAGLWVLNVEVRVVYESEIGSMYQTTLPTVPMLQIVLSAYCPVIENYPVLIDKIYNHEKGLRSKLLIRFA